MKNILLALFVVTFAAACSKSTAAETKAADDKGSTKKADDTTAKKGVALPKLGLKIDMPSDSVVTDGLGKNGTMLVSTDTSLEVAEPTDNSPATAQDALDDAKMFNGVDVKNEKLDDGWAVTFKNTGSAGDNYWVTVRRKIAGKDVMCTTALDTAAKQQAAVAACKSIHA